MTNRAGLLTPVYHGESGVRTLRELSRSYLAASKDLTRVMNRLKAIYSELVDSLRRPASLFPAPSCRLWLEKLRERRRCDRSTAVDTERRFIHLSTTHNPSVRSTSAFLLRPACETSLL
jgi:hypothetical protein